MRKVRDYDSELKALSDKARTLKTRRTQQLGVLVAACGADAMDAETLAGALILAVEDCDDARRETCRVRGAAFFQERCATDRGRACGKPGSTTAAATEASADRPATSA